jgi:hypothetical protein
MNAAANNMSLLTLHSFEFGHYMEKNKETQVTQEKVVRNIEAHASFIAQKSGQMR